MVVIDNLTYNCWSRVYHVKTGTNEITHECSYDPFCVLFASVGIRLLYCALADIVRALQKFEVVDSRLKAAGEHRLQLIPFARRR